MEPKLVICNPKDVELLAKLSITTFRNAFEKDNNPDDFEDYIKKAFSIDTLRKEIQNPKSTFYFIYLEETIVGYLKVNADDAQSDIHDKNAIELERIYILNEFQGNKLGGWSLQKVLQLAKESDKKYVWLGVWEHNERAIIFYERFGFKKFGKHPYYIGSDKQTDWLLRYDF